MSFPLTTAEGLVEIVEIPVGTLAVEGELKVPDRAKGIILFPIGNGFSRYGAHIPKVAQALHADGFATLTLNLLASEEKVLDAQTEQFRDDIGLLSCRLVGATDFVSNRLETRDLNIGYLGTHTGAAAAIHASSERKEKVKAIVSWSGRPTVGSLSHLEVPMLFIVGEKDASLLALTEKTLSNLQSKWKLSVIPGASHHFDEPDVVTTVSSEVRAWFGEYLLPQGLAKAG